MTTRLEAGIVCRDAALLLRFYDEVLGFEHVSELEFAEGTVHKLRRQEAWLKMFDPAAAAQPPAETALWSDQSGFRYAALYLASADEVAERATAAAQNGGAILREPATHRPNASVALISDPEGNVWELLWDGTVD